MNGRAKERLSSNQIRELLAEARGQVQQATAFTDAGWYVSAKKRVESLERKLEDALLRERIEKRREEL